MRPHRRRARIARAQEHRAYWTDAPAYHLPRVGVSLVGVKKGRLTVLGVLTEARPENRRARWLVRCACGGFEVRSAKALGDAGILDDACYVCRLAEGRYSAAADAVAERKAGEGR